MGIRNKGGQTVGAVVLLFVLMLSALATTFNFWSSLGITIVSFPASFGYAWILTFITRAIIMPVVAGLCAWAIFKIVKG